MDFLYFLKFDNLSNKWKMFSVSKYNIIVNYLTIYYSILTLFDIINISHLSHVITFILQQLQTGVNDFV